jgi:membrane fusion protein, multidrug efflux system
MLRTSRVRRYRIAASDAVHAHPTERSTDPTIVCRFSQDAALPKALPALVTVALLAACGPEAEPAPPEVRPVRVITIEERTGGDTVSLTGTVQAATTVNLAFRIDGRMTERLANVGDTVTPGELIARLDPANEEDALRAARADVDGAMGQLVEAQNNYERQRTLLRDGWTTRVR